METTNKPILRIFSKRMDDLQMRAQVLLWLELRSKQMMGYTFIQERSIDQMKFDFFCADLMLGIQIYERPQGKRSAEVPQGITVFRFTAEQICEEMQEVLRHIENYIQYYERRGLK